MHTPSTILTLPTFGRDCASGRAARALVAGLILAVSLSACGHGLFGHKKSAAKDEQTAADDTAPPKFPKPKFSGEGAPDLASVPDTAPTPPATKQEQDKVIEGLIADRERARYTDQESRIAPVDVRPLAQSAAVPDEEPAAPPHAKGSPVAPVAKLQPGAEKAPPATVDELAARADIPPPPPPPSDTAGAHALPAASVGAVGPSGPSGSPGGKSGGGPGPGPRPFAALGVRSDGFRALDSYEKTGGGTNRVASISFSLSSTTLTPADRRTLGDAAQLAQGKGNIFRVIAKSKDASEQSQSRATAVARELQRQGIPQDHIFVGTDSGPEGSVDVIMDQ